MDPPTAASTYRKPVLAGSWIDRSGQPDLYVLTDLAARFSWWLHGEVDRRVIRVTPEYEILSHIL